MMLFILCSLCALGFFIGSVKAYLKLKQYFRDVPEEPETAPSDSLVDVLFNERLRNDPDARKIQKQTIGLFCAALLMVHVAMLFYGAGMR
ncbi:hypothetical protein [Pontiella agarivorans]|uniref:Uncharacterized protein n=1 Tax=Pontiella agarivorans TaxID=3038953 RepID=A0ABU5MYJ1_9BACT|nr:hypothetical protein [Pontiella agarivorans]MDZ8119258.1 hypothetical protein [Pontiella agarivorans]